MHIIPIRSIERTHKLMGSIRIQLIGELAPALVFKRIMEEKGAAESYICSLLLKPEAYKKDIKIDYVAMEIPNDFIVGFGLDYDELGRNYKDIYVLDK